METTTGWGCFSSTCAGTSQVHSGAFATQTSGGAVSRPPVSAQAKSTVGRSPHRRRVGLFLVHLCQHKPSPQWGVHHTDVGWGCFSSTCVGTSQVHSGAFTTQTSAGAVSRPPVSAQAKSTVERSPHRRRVGLFLVHLCRHKPSPQWGVRHTDVGWGCFSSTCVNTSQVHSGAFAIQTSAGAVSRPPVSTQAKSTVGRSPYRRRVGLFLVHLCQHKPSPQWGVRHTDVGWGCFSSTCVSTSQVHSGAFAIQTSGGAVSRSPVSTQAKSTVGRSPYRRRVGLFLVHLCQHKPTPQWGVRHTDVGGLFLVHLWQHKPSPQWGVGHTDVGLV